MEDYKTIYKSFIKHAKHVTVDLPANKYKCISAASFIVRLILFTATHICICICIVMFIILGTGRAQVKLSVQSLF